MSKATEYNKGRLSDEEIEWLIRDFQQARSGSLLEDGMFGPNTKRYLHHVAEVEGWKNTPKVVTGKEWAEAALARLKGVLGQGEEGGNNQGPFITKIGGVQGRAWCARLISWALREGWHDVREAKGYAYATSPIQSTGGARELCRRLEELGAKEYTTTLDVPNIRGCIILWARGNPNNPEDKWKGHVGMGTEDKGFSWYYIAGNEGPYPAKVEVHKGRSYRLETVLVLPDVFLD